MIGQPEQWQVGKIVMRNQRGFTLLELIIVITIAALLVTMAVPGYQSLILRNRMSTAANELTSALNLARSEAIRRNRSTVVCKSSDGAGCGSAAASWSEGWLVFVDDDNDQSLDNTEPVLRVHGAQPDDYALSLAGNFTDFVVYRSNGRSDTIGNFTLCKGNTVDNARLIMINRAGRVRLGSDNNGNGIPEDNSGSDIAACN